MRTEAHDMINAGMQAQTSVGNFIITGGLTKREYFAAFAMMGSRSRGTEYKNWSDLAADSVEIADALIKALNEGEGNE